MTTPLVPPVLRYLRHLVGYTQEGLGDGELLDRYVQSGDEAAFAELLRRHGRMVFGVCRSFSLDAHDAEDAFQAVFLVLVRSARSVKKQGSLASWLNRVAYRTALKARAAAARRRRQEQITTTIQQLPSPCAVDS